MEWLYSLFIEHSALQAVVVLSLISAIGLGLGKIHVCGISLGVTFVFFAGILAGHFGLSIDPQMLNYAESFGLIIFVYALGLQVGPGFFQLISQGRGYVEYACHRSSDSGYVSCGCLQLYHRSFVTQYGRHSVWCHH